MPRRTPDQGVKPFEFRTGVGGLPPLGGIFRAGDPATVPPNKHHMVINARITPGGLYSRPGLETLYDTQIGECITGITEFNKLGGGVLLWPGAPLDAGNGMGANNQVSMRTIFPTRSNVYSEYVFFVAGALDPVSGNGQSVVNFAPNGETWGTTAGPNANRPFIHRGQVHYWTLASAGGSQPILHVAPMPESSGVQGTDYYRSTYCLTAPQTIVGATTCPPGTGWPRGHPFGVPERVLDLPAAPWGGGVTYWDVRCISIPERGDQVLDGDLAVDATLYILATGKTAGTVYKTKLYRWNGTSLSEEAAAVADFNTATDGAQYRARIVESGGGGLCIFVGGNDTAGDGGKAYVRGDSGAWTAVTGLRNGVTKIAFLPDHGFTWNGTPYFVGLGTSVTAKKLFIIKRGATSFEIDKDFFASDSIQTYYVSHAGQVGPSLYFLIQGSASYNFLPALVIHYDIPSKTITGNVPLRPATETDAAREALWLAVAGTTCYAGGLMQYDLDLADVEPTNCHSVWDVTDTTAPQMLYRVYQADFEEHYGNQYSFGAMPLIPASGETGQSVGTI